MAPQGFAHRFDTVIAFEPDLVLVSAGFGAFVRDLITVMSLETDDSSTPGAWLRASQRPATAGLERGCHAELPQRMDAALTGSVREGAA